MVGWWSETELVLMDMLMVMIMAKLAVTPVVLLVEIQIVLNISELAVMLAVILYSREFSLMVSWRSKTPEWMLMEMLMFMTMAKLADMLMRGKQ